MGRHAWIVQKTAVAMLGLATLAASVAAAWGLGVAWGLVVLLSCLLGFALWAGRDVELELEHAEENAGTLVAPGHAASFSGQQRGEGIWIPPGYEVVHGPGIITDERGNTVGPGRIVGPAQHNNTLL